MTVRWNLLLLCSRQARCSTRTSSSIIAVIGTQSLDRSGSMGCLLEYAHANAIDLSVVKRMA